MKKTVVLKFDNADAGLLNISTVECTRSSVALIAEWYGSHCAGDDYTVEIDGERVKIDQNGAIVPVTIDA